MEDYALHGVKEYWLIETKRQYVEQYYIKHGSFFLHKMHGEGDIIQSDVIAGLQLPVNAVFNAPANNQYLKQFF
jgi:Uma2 family endonuclease